jgi:hypothetical protein
MDFTRQYEAVGDAILEVIDDNEITAEDIAQGIAHQIDYIYEYYKSRADKICKLKQMMTNDCNQTWVVPIESDPINGDFYVTFPDELINKTGWTPGDTLEWIQGENDSYVLRKVEATS